MSLHYKIIQIFTIIIVVNAQNPTVKIEEGEVQGILGNTVDTGKEYYAFRGIPFAEPPIGKLRFKPPVPKKPWKGVFNATEDGAICPQGDEGSEDCLSINVYTPSLKTQNIPVMAVLFGGQFIAGSVTYDSYGPDYFLEKDVIVVSFNYRIGLFGFLSTGDEVVPGNNGLKDQVLALKWIQKNIRAFGGDPDRVTIFGGSAGGVVVSYLLHTELTKGLFSGAIMQSGVSIMPWSFSLNHVQTAFDTGRQLGIDTNDTTELVNYLRKVDFRDIVDATDTLQQLMFGTSSPKDGFLVGPVIEPPHEGAFITKKVHQLLSEGKFQNVPSIIGFSSMECNYDLGNVLSRIMMYEMYDKRPKNLVARGLNIPSDELATQAGKEIKSFYFGQIPIALQTARFMIYSSEDQFVRPTREFVRLLQNKSDVFYFRYDYQGDLPLHLKKVLPGASHSEEMAYMWRKKSVPHVNTTRDIRMQQRFITMWTNFMKYRNPTPELDPLLENKIWLPSRSLGTNNFVYLNIDDNLNVSVNPHEKSMQFWDEFYDKYAVPPLNTY